MEIINSSRFEAIRTVRDEGFLANPHCVESLLAVSEQTGIPVDRIADHEDNQQGSLELHARHLWIYCLIRCFAFTSADVVAMTGYNRSKVHYAIKSLDTIKNKKSFIHLDKQALLNKFQ